jgi:site-specific DNA recombinase
MPTSRAVAYLRLSDSVDDSTSIVRQRRDLAALAEREGWEIVRELADDGISGRKARANATEALRMLRDGEAEVLVVWKLDRFTRQGIPAVGALIDTLDATPSALFVALVDGLRSDQSSWRIIAAVLSEVARTEADTTSTRARSAIAYRKTVTYRFTGGGTIPFGYASAPAPEGPGRVLVLDPREAEVVRDVADRILDGESLSRVAADLTARGIPTSKSAYRRARYRGVPDEGLDRGRWTVGTIRALWSSHSLVGRVSLGDDVVRDEDGLPVTVWPPILDLATLERLRVRIGLRTSGQAPRRRAARLLSGVAFCAYCDRRLYVTTSGGRPIYACASSRNGVDCVSPKVDALHLEEYVSGLFLSARGNDPEVDLVETVADSTSAQLVEVEAALREATGALLADDADAPALLRRIDALKVARAALRSAAPVVSSELVPTGRTLADAWAAADDEARRGVLLAALDHLTVSRGTAGRRVDASRVSFFWHS